MVIREAGLADNDALLSLTRAAPMHGLISLRIDRDPDFFRLAQLRGRSKTLVAETDTEIVGCISVTHQEVFIDGHPENILYVGDLKVHPDHRSRGIAKRLMHALQDYVRMQSEDLVFCVVAAGNRKLLGLLDGVGSVPPFISTGRFMVYSILPTPLCRPSPYEITTGEKAGAASLRRLLETHNRAYQFAPVLSEDAFVARNGSGAALRPDKMLVASENGAVRAALTPFDPSGVKSDVVIDMPSTLHAAVRLMEWAGRLVPMFVPPRVGEALRLIYLRDIACADGHFPALRTLLQQVRRRAFDDGYSFVTVGLHERDPLLAIVRGMPKFTFVSEGFVTSVSGRTDAAARVAAGIFREDFALV